jgi:hypothetical protein
MLWPLKSPMAPPPPVPEIDNHTLVEIFGSEYRLPFIPGFAECRIIAGAIDVYSGICILKIGP